MALSGWAARVAVILCAFPILPSAASPAESAPPLVPHQAVYDLSLLKGGGSKAPLQARGRIAFDFSGSPCDGYVQTFRQATELQPEEGSAQSSDMRSATFEAGDGSEFRFMISTKAGEGKTERTEGFARKSKGEKLSVELSKPKRSRLEYAGPILFPTEHMRRILTAARAEQTILEARVYDGSGDGAKVYQTLTIIGKSIAAPPNEKPAQIEAFKSMRRWPVSVSYFEEEKKDEPPAYILAFELYENGVSIALKLDYGDFILAGEMMNLKLLPQPKCDK
jgi:hypothetical protein